MLNRFFQDELEFLRDLSREFAREYPTLAPALAEAGSDSDVERVLQGTAFLTSLLRQKLEDDLPELTQTMIQMLWPHYLRPVPSTCIVEFAHPGKPRITATEQLPAGRTEIDSVPVDGTPCRFRTCYDVAMNPLRIAQASRSAEGRGSLRLEFELLGGASIADLQLDPLRVYLHGELSTSSTLYLWLLRHTETVRVEWGRGSPRRHMELPRHPHPVRPAGFAPEESLFPYPAHSFPGYRLLQEYFTLPQKFLFLDLHGLDSLRQSDVEGRFDVVFHFDERLAEGLRVSEENFRLHCTPVVNLTQRDADPIRLDQQRSQYLLRASDPEPDHFEVYSVENVVGLVQGSSERRSYRPFYAFDHPMDAEGRHAYYKLHRSNAVGKPNSDCHLSFVDADEQRALPDVEFVSVELVCTNRRLPESLKPGDLSQHTDRSPHFAEFRNLTPPTTSVVPPLEGGFHWRLISHLSLNHVSLADAAALRGLLSLYDFTALHNQQAARATQHLLDGIVSLQARGGEVPLEGSMIRGNRIELGLDENHFAAEGELYLFSSILEEFFSLYVTVNSFSQLTVRGAQRGEVYEWPPRIGRQFTL